MKMETETETHMPPPPPQPPPTLPKISGDPDILLDIYTHESIQFPGMNMEKNTEYGDTKRLACLGHKAYELFATEALFSKKPLLNADVLQVCQSSDFPFISVMLIGLHSPRLSSIATSIC